MTFTLLMMSVVVVSGACYLTLQLSKFPSLSLKEDVSVVIKCTFGVENGSPLYFLSKLYSCLFWGSFFFTDNKNFPTDTTTTTTTLVPGGKLVVSEYPVFRTMTKRFLVCLFFVCLMLFCLYIVLPLFSFVVVPFSNTTTHESCV